MVIGLHLSNQWTYLKALSWYQVEKNACEKKPRILFCKKHMRHNVYAIWGGNRFFVRENKEDFCNE